MLTFSFETNAHLVSCGIDCENISRFQTYSLEKSPLPFVFSKTELDHCKNVQDSAEAFCASFSCKEALFKALGMHYDFTLCELFYEPGKDIFWPKISFSGKEYPVIDECVVHFLKECEDELIAIVYLLKKHHS